MESQPQNPEFRINPENFHPCLTLSFPSTQTPNDTTIVCVNTKSTEKVPFLGPKGGVTGDLVTKVVLRLPTGAYSRIKLLIVREHTEGTCQKYT